MKNLILIILSFAFLIPCMSQDMITISGQVKMIGNPCLSEECPPGVVWAIETDTASFILTQDNDWLWGDFQLMINGKEYLENDFLTVTGEIHVKHDWNDDVFYEIEIDGYDSIMVESKTWSNLSGGYGVEMVECCYSTTFLKIETDPFINTIDEKQILASTDSLQSWSKIGNIKESGKKVYFRDLENNQGLLYDFGASVNEIVKVVNYAQDIELDTIVVRVEKIDTIEYLGIQRQRFEVKDTLSSQIDYWITGIGSIKGLLNPCLELCGGFRELLCVHDDGSQIYQNPNRLTCYINDTCTKPIANFDYYILESYPIQIDLESTAQYADSIIWKAISAYSFRDSIFGSGENIRIQNPYLFEVLRPDCEGCVSTISFTQIVINECGKDSISIEVPVENFTAIETITSDLIKLYPNPTNDYVNIDYFGETKKLRYSIINSTGQTVDSGLLKGKRIDLDLELGLYILQISSNNKLIIEDKILITN